MAWLAITNPKMRSWVPHIVANDLIQGGGASPIATTLGMRLGPHRDHDLIGNSWVSFIVGKEKPKVAVHFPTPLPDHCVELLSMAVMRLEQSSQALTSFPTRNKQDIQTWISAALTLQQTCKDFSIPASAADGRLGPGSFGSQLAQKMDYLSQLSSNALALINRQSSATSHGFGGSKSRGGLPGWVFRRERKLLQSTVVKANAVVAKDGSGNYKTVSEAIAAASGGRFVIYVKSGVYKEKIRITKDGITLIGDGKYSTIIEGDDSVAEGNSLSGSATIAINGDGFIAKDIGFHNNAGPDRGRAVALTLASDRSVLYRCSIAGYQDTLYALILRQFYRECDISGTVDFIFGNAAAVFQNCDLILRQPGSKSSYNVILANGRTNPDQNSGFSIQSCRIRGSSGSVRSYLGRPWKPYSRAVVMQSTIDASVEPRGWIEWPGYGSSVLRTLYFAEYANEGPGAGTAGRVKWGGFHVIGAEEAVKFTVGSFIAGTSWLPSTGVTFISGLH
ncbi:hypothetical protein CRG98_018383 [Punica granatum]|uniref:Pectinesterase n=1 Tax=Punica granatum TaxID=22663 RepID=A0A2I0JY63_PUNGR|nr:hypothetical protein CRG98_018383 [Punica granatum]